MSKEVIIRGNKRKVPDHMLKDLELFGVSRVKVVVKETPKELIKPAETQAPKEVKSEEVASNLPEMVIDKTGVQDLPPADNSEKEPKTRKAPVRSKSKK